MRGKPRLAAATVCTALGRKGKVEHCYRKGLGGVGGSWAKREGNEGIGGEIRGRAVLGGDARVMAKTYARSAEPLLSSKKISVKEKSAASKIKGRRKKHRDGEKKIKKRGKKRGMHNSWSLGLPIQKKKRALRRFQRQEGKIWQLISKSTHEFAVCMKNPVHGTVRNKGKKDPMRINEGKAQPTCSADRYLYVALRKRGGKN